MRFIPNVMKTDQFVTKMKVGDTHTGSLLFFLKKGKKTTELYLTNNKYLGHI